MKEGRMITQHGLCVRAEEVAALQHNAAKKDADGVVITPAHISIVLKSGCVLHYNGGGGIFSKMMAEIV